MPSITSAPDFKSSQIVTSMIITSGATGTPARLLIFDVSGSANTSGSLSSAFSTGKIGQDVYFFVSGNIGSRGTSPAGSTPPGVALFAGDTVASGSGYVERSLTVGGTGTFGDNFYVSNTNSSANFSGTMTVGNTATMQASIYQTAPTGLVAVSGSARFAGNVHVIGLTSGVFVSGSTTTNILSASGNTTLSSNVFLDGIVTAVLVSGSTRFDHDVWMQNSAKLLNVSGTATFGSNVYVPSVAHGLFVSGNMHVGAGAQLSSSVLARPALSVTGTAAFGAPTISIPGGNITFFVSGGIGSATTGTISGLTAFSGDVQSSGSVLVISGILHGAHPSIHAHVSTGSWKMAGVIGSNISAADTLTPTANQIYFVPHVFEERTYISQIAIYVVSGFGGSQMATAIYTASSSNDIRPDRLIFSQSAFHNTTSPAVYSSDAKLVINPGLYWFALNGSSPGVMPSIRSPGVGQTSPVLGMTNSDFTSVTFILSASANTIFPSSLGGTFTDAASRVPGIAYKRIGIPL